MNKQSAYEQNTLIERLREWFHPAERRLREIYRLGIQVGEKRAIERIPVQWREPILLRISPIRAKAASRPDEWHLPEPPHYTLPDPVPCNTQQTGAFLLDIGRDTLFEDVPQLGESLDDDNAPTVLHPRTRAKQKWQNAMSQLLPPVESE